MTQGYFLVKFGDSRKAFSLQETTLPALSEGFARINVEAFGLNFADVMARNGKYREAPSLPFIPGYDIVGVVEEVNHTDKQSLVGKRVAGFCRFGGYAKQAATPVDALVEIGDMNADDALSLCTQGVTASYMVDFLSESHQGQTALVHAAAGGVGSLVLQLLQLKGIHTIAKVRSNEKAETLKKINPTNTLIASTGSYSEEVKSLLNGKKLIAVFNAVGGATIKQDLQLLDSGGVLFLFGGASLLKGKFGLLSLLNFVRKTGFFSPIPLMMKSTSMVGVNMLKVADHNPTILSYHLNRCFSLYSQKQLAPLPAKRYHHTQLAEAHEWLESGKSTGKITIYWEDLV